MDPFLDLMNFKLLAKGDIFELLGPLFVFGFYVIVTLIKKWASSSSQEPGGKPSQELQRAVRAKYKEIHDKQTGKTPEMPKFQPHTKPVANRPISRPQKFEQPVPVRQVPERQTAYPVQIQRQHRSVLQMPRTEPRYRPKTITAKAEPPKPVKEHKPEKKIVSSKKPQEHNISVYTEMLSRPQDLRSAIILKEILDKPISLRNTY